MVSENLVSKKISVSENLVWEKSLGFICGKFGIRKKVLVSVSVKILVSSFSARGLGGWGRLKTTSKFGPPILAANISAHAAKR